MNSFFSQISGKNVIVYRSQGNKKCNTDDIKQYLRKFQLNEALRLIGHISYQILERKEAVHTIKGVPISQGILAYLSMNLIESSNDYRSKQMSEDDLVKAIDMFFGLPDPLFEDKEGIACLMRYGLSQFNYNNIDKYCIPRTLILYQQLWNKLPTNIKPDINVALKKNIGLNLNEILTLSFSFAGSARRGFIRLYEDTETYPEPFKSIFLKKKQLDFIKWISCRYQEFREMSQKELDSLPSKDYEKFRFNPLTSYPIIIPDRNPKATLSQVYLVPIPTLIDKRVTTGLYFELSEYFKDGNANTFRNAFGHVFQDYVGILLEKVFGEDNVKQEFKYGSKKQSLDSPDLFLIQEDSVVLIEVKQAGLYLNSKKWGKQIDIRSDLKKSIAKAVNQMITFEENLRARQELFPEWLKQKKIVDRLVIIYDSSHFLNSVIRDEIYEMKPEISKEYHWHTIKIDELEKLLGIAEINFFKLLLDKRSNDTLYDMDFHDYHARIYPEKAYYNTFLEDAYQEFIGTLNVSDNLLLQQ